jgi:four helix bundle protein
MANSILKDKSYVFALKVIKVYKAIIAEKKEYTLGRQFLDAGTAIGALIREAEFAQSKADFISKMNIALKESNETEYWISLLKDSDFITTATAKELDSDNKELLRMLVSSIKTAKQNSKK